MAPCIRSSTDILSPGPDIDRLTCENVHQSINQSINHQWSNRAASDPPERLSLLAEEVSESSIKLSWQFPSETLLQPVVLVSGGPPEGPGHQQQLQHPQQQHPHRPAAGHTTGEQVDGFVLTFAKVSGAAGRLRSASSTVAQPRAPQAPDSAARISLQPPPTEQQHQQQLPPVGVQHSQWQAVQLAPQQRRHLLKNLDCGSWYAIKIWAFNKVGKGEPSELVTVSTRGKGEWRLT